MHVRTHLDKMCVGRLCARVRTVAHGKIVYIWIRCAWEDCVRACVCVDAHGKIVCLFVCVEDKCVEQHNKG